MKVSDYIVRYLIIKGVTDVFGYPGGMVTHLIDSLGNNSDKITNHLTYNEQGAAFAACGYAQATGKVGVAYATSGPGATNLVTGICNAYFDSIPTIFITGQVNTFEGKGDLPVRQRGFQETDIVSMTKNVTKFSKTIEDANLIKWYLDKAFFEATSGRKGPVLLDIPMDVSRSEVDEHELSSYEIESQIYENSVDLIKKINQAKRPVFLFGNGVKISGCVDLCRQVIEKIGIPVVTSMIAVDVASYSDLMYGFVGAYGTRTANFILSKCDLLISIGARLDVRQVGAIREKFASDAEIIRYDIDKSEFSYGIHSNDICIQQDARTILSLINDSGYEKSDDLYIWLDTCACIKKHLKLFDDEYPNEIINRLSKVIDDNVIITTDVGQNQVWTAQSFKFKANQKALFSGGHGAMGYSLPAAIGATIGSGKNVISFNGDGGIQMNIQELQVVAREKLPIKIVIINNESLGMIRHFQEMYFEGRYYQTLPQTGFTNPKFELLANAYGLRYKKIENIDDIDEVVLNDTYPIVLEVFIKGFTYVKPKLKFGNPNQDQDPPIDRKLYKYLLDL